MQINSSLLLFTIFNFRLNSNHFLFVVKKRLFFLKRVVISFQSYAIISRDMACEKHRPRYCLLFPFQLKKSAIEATEMI